MYNQSFYLLIRFSYPENAFVEDVHVVELSLDAAVFYDFISK